MVRPANFRSQAAYKHSEGFPEGFAELIGKRRINCGGNVTVNKLLRLFVYRHGNLFFRTSKSEFSNLFFDRLLVVFQIVNLLLDR